MTKTKKISLIGIAAVLALTLTLTCVLVACGKPAGDSPKTTTDVATSFVNIDINPSVELVLDQNNTVMAVKAENVDAEVLISGADGIVGCDVNLAVKRIGSLAIDMNYVQDNSSINVSVTSDINTEELKNLRNSIESNLQSAVSELNVVVQDGLDLAVSYELDAIKAAYPEDDNIQALTVEKYRLVRSAMLCKFDLTFSEAAKMSTQELATIVKDTKTLCKAKISETLIGIYNDANRSYQDAKEIILDFAYPICTFGNDTNYQNSLNYLGLHIQELCMKHAYDTIKTQVLDKEFTKAEVEEIANVLYDNQDDVTAFVNGSKDSATGKWTKGSIMHYVDMQYRRLANDQREAFKEKYKTASLKIEEEIAKPHTFDATTSWNDFEATISVTIPGFTSQNMKDLNKQVINGLDKEIPETTKDYEVRIAEVSKKMATAKQTMLDGITKEQTINRIELLQNTYTTTIQSAEKALSIAINKANEAATNWLKTEQANRQTTTQKAA